MKTDYRLLIQGRPLRRYLTRRNGHVSYFSGNETLLSLSNLVQNRAAELRFALEDARDGAEAAEAVRAILGDLCKNQPESAPNVVVLP